MRLGNGICHVFLEESQPQWGIERGFPEVSAIIQDHKHLLELAKDILLHEVVLEKYADDLVVKQLVAHEKNHVESELQSQTLALLCDSSTVWVSEHGELLTMTSTRELNGFLRMVLDRSYKDAPHLQ